MNHLLLYISRAFTHTHTQYTHKHLLRICDSLVLNVCVAVPLLTWLQSLIFQSFSVFFKKSQFCN